ncbi:MAG: type I phosphomannose isomerase catalytic subunit [Verrucomicrobiota bacterium]
MSVLTFEPIYQERIWGGRTLETSLNRQLPPETKIGESWEVSDREEAQSQVAGKNASLHQLWTSAEKATLFGTAAPASERFPLLIKVLDAKEKLSLQVHPPAHLAEKFDGEPKTECWYFIETEKEAEIYVGLKEGVTRDKFSSAIEDKTVADCFHVLPTQPGETMFLPSGRVHAIGGGNLILEVQQNSDTTFRVYDWDRVDAKTGQPRQLHIQESLECIDYDDIEPIFTQPHGETVIECVYFNLYRSFFFDKESRHMTISPKSCVYGFNSHGRFKVGDQELERGTSFMITADSGEIEISCLEDEGELLTVTWPG